MNSQDYFRFLLGRAETIDRLARAPSTPWVGLALALLAGIPREYDQESLVHAPWYFLLPVLASLVLGLLYHALLKGNGLQQTQRSEWQFLGLIWATAPLAWLYAIPVERFLDPLNAARANVALLALVGTWRVLLFARVVEVGPGRLKEPPLLYSSRLGWRVTGERAREPGVSIRDGLLDRLAAAGFDPTDDPGGDDVDGG